MIRISVTQAAYRAIQASLPPNSIKAPTDSEAATVALWLDPKTVDRLSALRTPGDDLSDVILRLAQLEEPPLAKAQRPIEPRPEPDQRRNHDCAVGANVWSLPLSPSFPQRKGAAESPAAPSPCAQSKAMGCAAPKS
jgi:hypothetical protein